MKKTYYFIFATAVILFNYQNCGKVDFKQSEKKDLSQEGNFSSPPPIDPPDFEEIETSCLNQTHLQKIVVASFPSNEGITGSVCNWDLDSNGNKIMAERTIIARNEEYVNFDLPQNAVVCDLNFTIPHQTFRYDDVFYLNYNDVVIASSTSFFNGFQKWEGMDIYEWSKIKGNLWPLDYNESSYIYCVGAASSLSTCLIPPTQTAGPFELNIHKSLIQKMGTRATNSNQRVSLVIGGDNDDSIDCRHQALGFSITVSYILK